MSELGAQTEPIKVDWDNVVRFVRQLSHDLRNDLNAAELQSAYLAEIATGTEEKEEIKRLRQMLSTLGARLQKLSATVGSPKPNRISYPVKDFVEDLYHKVNLEFSDNVADVQWQNQASNGTVEVDPQLLQWALLEVLHNAFRHRAGGKTLSLTAGTDDSAFTVTLVEPKENFVFNATDWGRAPLANVGGGHYGLGLNRARNIIEAHGGQLVAEHDPQSGMLRTKIILPLAAGGQ